MNKLFALAATTAAVGFAESDLRAQSAADSASVTAFYGRWFGSAPQGFTAYASFYAADGYILPPGSPPVVGRAAIAAWFEQARASTPYVAQPQGIATDEMRFGKSRSGCGATTGRR